MGVLDRAKRLPGFGNSPDGSPTYVCCACDAEFELQYHRCPKCDSFDIRYSKWEME